MAIIHPGLGQLNSNYNVGVKKPLPMKKPISDTGTPVTQDSLTNVNFKAATLPVPTAPPSPSARVSATVAQVPQAPPQGTSFAAGGTLLMVDDQQQIKESSAIDGFLARIANGAKQGIESSGTVLKRCMTDAAALGNNIGRALGCEETLPGLRGGIGTSISLTTAMVGGVAAIPLAMIVGLADSVAARP